MSTHRDRIIRRQHTATVRPEQILGCACALRRVIEGGGEMLARVADAPRAAVMRQHLLVERVDDGPLLDERRRRFTRAACEEARHLSRPPWAPLRGATDHHRVGAGQCQRLARVVVTVDIAVDDHRDGDAVLDRAHGPPVGAPLVELAAGAPMHRDETDAGLLGAACKIGRVDRTVVPAEPHLQRDRHRDCRHGGLDQARCMIEVAHERGSRLAAGNVPRRAAHVDIDDRRARTFRDAGALAHPAGFATGELHHMDRDVLAFGPQQRLGASFDQRVAGGHLRHHQAHPEPRGRAPERRIGHPRHRRQNHRIRQRDAADLDRLR